ncbi:MAG: 4Fe-4S binding protein [Thermoplasmata archaeon]|nr:MAG: 4Fe-4S binding protein [Thermoplasmata archaeon]
MGFKLRLDNFRMLLQVIALVTLNFTVIGSLMVSPFLPILRLPKVFPGMVGEGVPLCILGSWERTLTTWWPILLMIGLLSVLALICIIFGRALCGWACPIGFTQDLIDKARNKLGIRPVEPSSRRHERLGSIRFAVLLFVTLIAFSIGLSLLVDEAAGEVYRSQWPAMAQTAPICVGCPVPVIRYMTIDVIQNQKPNLADPTSYLQIFVFFLFFVGAFTTPRLWCRYVCPVGALSSCFNKVSMMSISKEQNKCTKCDVCINVCPTKVQNVKESDITGKIGDTGCIYCLKCVKACPEKALALKLRSKEIYNGDGIWKTRTTSLSSKNQ